LSAGESLCGPESALVGHAAVCGGFNWSPVLDYRFQANPSIVSASRPCTFYPSAQPLTGLRLLWWCNTSVIDACFGSNLQIVERYRHWGRERKRRFLMGYFDGLASASFKSDAHGNTIFFPYGRWGKGRFIADIDSAEQLKKFISRFYMVAFGMTLVVGVTAGYIWTFIATPFVMLWYFQGIKKFLKDAPFSDEKMSSRESMRNMASGMNKYLIWFFFLSSLLFTAAAIFLSVETGDLSLGLAGGGFSAVCALVFAFMLRSK
jgi:hypothetical protein